MKILFLCGTNKYIKNGVFMSLNQLYICLHIY